MRALDQELIAHSHEKGYVIADDVLNIATDVQPVVGEYTRLLDELVARWYAEG